MNHLSMTNSRKVLVRFIEMYLVESSNLFPYSLQGRETGVAENDTIVASKMGLS